MVREGSLNLMGWRITGDVGKYWAFRQELLPLSGRNGQNLRASNIDHLGESGHSGVYDGVQIPWEPV